MTHESRIVKQSQTQEKCFKNESVYLLGLHEKNLKTHESLQKRIHIRRFPVPALFSHSSTPRKLIKYINYMIKSFLFCKKHPITLLQIHSIVLLPIAFLIKKTTPCKIIYDAHELETEKNGWQPWKIFIATYFEKFFIKYVDHTLVVSQNILRFYKKKYPKISISLILNSPKHKEPSASNYFRKKWNIKPDQNIFLYQGLLDADRGILTMLEAFKQKNKAHDQKDILVLLGFGTCETIIKQAAQENENIFFHEAISPQKLLNYTSSATYGIAPLIFNNAGLSYQYCMPNKFFEYCMAGLPVISGPSKELAETIRYHKLGIILENDSPEDFCNTIEILKSKNKQVLSNNCKSFSKNFNWNIEEKKLKTIYKEVGILN